MQSDKRKQIWTIPNILSFCRLLMVALILWLYIGKARYTATALVVLLSALTDVADGYIARHCDMVSDVGKILDPIADKCTQAALILCLFTRYALMLPLIIVFAIKELLMALMGYVTLRVTGAVNSARWYGKVCTTLLYTVMALLILFPAISSHLADTLIGLCFAAVLACCILYCRFYTNLLKGRLTDFYPDRRERRWLYGSLAFLWLLILGVCLLCRRYFSAEGIASIVSAHTLMAVFVLLSLFALKSLSLVVYSGLLFAASGVLFPLWLAILVNMLGILLMASLPYLLGSLLGSGAAADIVRKYPKAAALQTLRKKCDLSYVLLVRCIRLLPMDAASLYMGAAGIRYGPYLLGSLLGMLPSALAFAVMGMSAADPCSPAFILSAAAELCMLILSFCLLRRLQKKK